MKKLAFAFGTAAVILTLASCSGNNDKKEQATDQEAPKTTKVEGDKFTPTTNIRYYNMDSVMANYELVKTYNETNLRATRELENAMQSRQSELQRLANNIQQKVQSNGYLSEASYNADLADLNRKQQQAESYLGNLQARAQQEALRQQQEFLDSIDNFLASYNRDKHYDAILLYSPGQYFNPALDITADVISGLNARYKKSEKKADAPKTDDASKADAAK
ncbi:MAG: OmpH family outer membrane protein [Muribaculaceae bacterium]|nr:OmpH family outer membrane protein [Muribaculaceae bacterium]